MREDYPNEDIFSFQIWLLAGGFFGFLLSRILPVGNFWFPLLGGGLFGLTFARRKKFRIFEAADAISLPFFLTVSLVFFSFTVKFWKDVTDLTFLVEVVLGLVMVVISFVFAKYYRQFSWYPSGKVGFVSLASFAIYFLIRGILAFFPFSVLPFSSKILDKSLGFATAFVLLLILYFLSGRKVQEDLGWVFKRLRLKKESYG